MKMDPLIEGLQILRKYSPDKEGGWVAAEHDTFYAGDPSWEVSEEDIMRLEELGWNYDDSDGWYAFT